MDTSTRITVILCTHNRARTLAKALESIATQALSQSIGWEIVVVDNNSSDKTRQVIEDCRSRYPGRIRYVFEPQQGISYARNTGVRNAQGDILAFIDDDETASPGWLQNLTANLYSGEWSGAGGRILPQWNCPRPQWFSDRNALTMAPLVVFDPATEEGPLTQTPFGANMAFRKEMFDLHGGFRTDLGRVGKGLLSGEDTEFGGRLIAAGRRLRYEPTAVTYHPVEEFRIRREYFLEWWFNKGRSDVREFGNQPNKIRFLGVPLRLFRGLIMESLRWMVALEPSHRFICKIKVWACAGLIFEHYHSSLLVERNGTRRKASLSPPTEDGR